VTLTAHTGDAPLSAARPGTGTTGRVLAHHGHPVRAEVGDISVWQKIVVAIKRDPFGRTARQVEEVLQNAPPQGITNALSEVLVRSRQHLEAGERAEAARHIRSLVARSGLSHHEFASRIGAGRGLVLYLEGRVSPPASLVIRIRKLSDRFVRMRAQREEGGPERALADLRQMCGTPPASPSSAHRRTAAPAMRCTLPGRHGRLPVYPVNPTITEIDGAPTYPAR
jgi:hypothetical protein